MAIVTARPGEMPADAAARVLASSDTPLVCFVAPSTRLLDASTLARLAAEVRDGVVAATATLVTPLHGTARATPDDARVRERGIALDARDGAPFPRALGRGDLVDLGSPPSRVAFASAACLVVSRRAYDDAGAMPRRPNPDVAAFELCARLRARGGAIVAVPAAVAADDRPLPLGRERERAIAATDPSWRALLDDCGPALLREAAPLPPGSLRIAITVAAPSEKMAPRWGDWHLAHGLSDALGRLGHEVRVHVAARADDAASRASDVHLVLHGLAHVRRTAGQRHVLWIISHPETVDVRECDAADLVLVASHRFADHLRARTSTPVEVMLQATDTTRFRPVPADPRFRHDVAIVAKSRGVFRTAVATALQAGLRPALFGSGWEEFVDPALIAADHVDNEVVPYIYASTGVLLNDHWSSMREWGFVSNRLFDALACDTPVVSDPLPELDELFADAVPTYRDAAELRRVVDAALADPIAARERAAKGGHIVRTHHTMDHRARELLAALDRYGLMPRD